MSAKDNTPLLPPLVLKPRTFSGQVQPKLTNQIVLQSPHDRLSTLQSEVARESKLVIMLDDDNDKTPHESPT